MRLTAALVLAVVLTACASGGESSIELSPVGAEGRSIARSNGCAACHGSEGAGGVGPTFIGLWMSDRELTDGSIVVADRDYLHESITMPGVKIVTGYRAQMPSNNLDDDAVTSIVAWIEELGAP